MLEGTIKKVVDERLEEIYGSIDAKVDMAIERYARDVLKGAVLFSEPAELMTSPGTEVSILAYTPRTPMMMGGYIDLANMLAEDTIEIKIQLKLSKEAKWRTFHREEYVGHQKDPLLFFRDIFILDGIKITLNHKQGSPRKIQHAWYKRK